MVIQKKTPNLSALLESHVRESTTKVPIVPRPSTPIPPRPFPLEPTNKKRKRDK